MNETVRGQLVLQVILSHINLDFDGLASMLAAKKLYPNAKIVLPTKQGKSVERFLAIYRDTINYDYPSQINWKLVTEIILVDIASLHRIGEVSKFINSETINFTVYDHHEPNDSDVKSNTAIVEQVGATITLLVEEIISKQITISSFEATIFALGLYTDTGSFTYLNTTPRDLKAGSYLLEIGANLQIVSKFSEPPLQDEEQQLLYSLIQQSEEHYFEGIDILIAYHRQKEYTGGLALLARKALEMTGTDALIFVVEMGKRIFVVGRSTSDRIDILPIIKRLNGGGHKKAASAMVKNGCFEDVLNTVRVNIHETVKPSITAKDMMSSPVKVISTITTIDDAAKMMLRYGHTGFPVLENERLVGIISRRDIDKAKHHGLGHAPVKGYMSTDPITINSAMSIEEVQNLMIDKNVGRLPVIENNQLIGIISRTNVIEALHGEKIKAGQAHTSQNPIEVSLLKRMYSQLSDSILMLLKTVGEEADKINYRAFLIGGIVRDLVIGRANEDIDIVVEGDGINFANTLAAKIGGDVRAHEKFGTATWKHPSGLKIDITSARTEYYDYPAALPTVVMSSLKEDLFRRDFTINAMAIQLNKGQFGQLIDFFHGYDDILQRKLRILYNLSFVEDPTRILRAVRFEQRFDFEMDKQTIELAQNSVDKIASTSKPRLASELKILLNEAQPVEALKRLHELGVLHYLLGSLQLDETILQDLENFKLLIDDVKADLNDSEKSIDQAWICYLILLFSKQDCGFEEVEKYTLNNGNLKIIHEIETLQEKDFPSLEAMNKKTLHTLLKHYQVESILCFIILTSQPKAIVEMVKTYLYARENIPTFIDGSDLKALNIHPGPIFSEILYEIDCAYLNGEISSKEDAVLMVKRNYLS